MEVKESIYRQLQEMLTAKIEVTTAAISSLRIAKNSDTKSSAGDKYETGRAMMQMELDKEEQQLNQTTRLKNELAGINLEKKHSQVEFGSLVETNQGIYFISIPVGKVTLADRDYFVLSLASPIGKLLEGKKIGEKAIFQGREFLIQGIL
jgi:transcription elongation GreA/GreB family factor